MREITWRDASGEHRGAWPSASEPPAGPVGDAGDATRAAEAVRRARAGEHLLYRGDWHNARQLLAAMGRRLAAARPPLTGSLPARWRAYRRWRREDHVVLSRLLVPVEPDLGLPLRRAPDLRSALAPVFEDGPGARLPALLPLREALGAVGAAEWRRRGVPVPALGGRVHPHHGVFAPVRGEYVSLLAAELDARPAGWLAGRTAFDVGTGTGVLAVLVARRGARVTATDLSPRAVSCAAENAARFGVGDRVDALCADLFPPGRADLVVANPPWLPGEPETPLDRAVYDAPAPAGGASEDAPAGGFLERFVAGLAAHLAPGGEGWLVLSDLAEILGLRPPGEVERLAAAAGLEVAGRRAAGASHPRAADPDDPLHEARSRETVTLYRLVPASPVADARPPARASSAAGGGSASIRRTTSSTGRRGVGRSVPP
jgi:SAM-dependent methyltransferase